MTDTSARPLAVIDAELALTRQAIAACDQLVKVALDERYKLLSEGWPANHGFCEALDAVAARWAREREAQRRALLVLMAERDRDAS